MSGVTAHATPLAKGGATHDQPLLSLAEADRASSSAVALSSYSQGRQRLRRAQLADPFNPLHLLRAALFEMRFGRWEQAIAFVDLLATELAPKLTPLPVYLRSLALLREGEPKRAENVLAPLLSGAATFPPARFLNAEIHARLKIKSLASVVRQLPRGEGTAALWVDLLSKLFVVHGKEGAAASAEFLKQAELVPDGSPEARLLDRLRELSGADFDRLEQLLVTDRPDSRAEELTLLFYYDRLQEESQPRPALARLGRLHRRFPDRPAIRRLYVALLARLAVAEARAERYIPALVLVERCQAIEPCAAVHYQNRASLFTLLKEIGPYHEAWFEANRHLYRLALFGKLADDDALRLAKLHRLFAQQARLTRDDPARGQRNLGIFRTEPTAGSKDRPRLRVNQQRIEQDAEQLRQWIYHRQAELLFLHWRLGSDPFRFLLHPTDRYAVRARLNALGRLGRALAVLVPEEGSALGEQLVVEFRRRAAFSGSRYGAADDDVEVERVAREHLQTMADLLTLCLGWRPPGQRPDLIDAVIEFIHTTFAFLSDTVLYAAAKQDDGDTGNAIGALHAYVNELLDLGGLEPPLTEEQLARIPKSLESMLLSRMSYAVYNQHRLAPGAVDKAMEYVDRARLGNADDPDVELTAARLLTLGGYFDEARQAIKRFYRFDGQRDREAATEAEKVQENLEEKRKKGEAGRQRTDAASPPEPVATGDLEGLLQELQDRPSSIQAYEQVVHHYVELGRFDEALAWSERAVAKCLSRRAQLRARSVNLEALGLRDLAKLDRSCVELYLRGAHHPSLELLANQPADTPMPYPLLYVRGRCQLALAMTKEAAQSFSLALAGCDRPLHRVVLRRLSSNLDETYIEFVRQRVGDQLATGQFQAALDELAASVAQLRQPELILLDVADALLRRGLQQVQSGAELGGPFVATVRAAWNDRLSEALSAGSDIVQARKLAELSCDLCPESKSAAEALITKAIVYERQLHLGLVLARSAEHLHRAEFDTALAVLEEVAWAAEQPRVLRQRATILLQLERFDDARAVVRQMENSETELACQFVVHYPSLDLKKRLQVARRLLREGQAARASALLEQGQARSAEEVLEWTYQRAFALALEGYRSRRQGEENAARQQLAGALHLVEGCLSQARAAGHAQLVQLYEKLDNDLDSSP